MTASNAAIRRGVLFGITHTKDGTEIIREPRLLKVSIGHPKGPAITVWMQNGKWRGLLGYKPTDKPVTFSGRPEAERWYSECIGKYRSLKQADPKSAATKAMECNHPRKVGFFLFTKQAADGIMEPDFAAIEAHGSMPTEIDIVFLDDNPLDAQYQMWSASELRCHGDGINAERVLSLAGKPWQQYQPPADELELAEAARKDGLKFFPIMDGCWTCGCPYSQEYSSNRGLQPSPCKPGGDLKFQLLKNIRVGGVSYFHTTGIRSIQNLFGGLFRIKTLTGGRIAGVPLKLSIKPFKSNHNGQPALQYGVMVEFRADTMEALRQNLIEQAMKFRQAAELPMPGVGPARQIAAPVAALPAPATSEPEDGAVEAEDEALQAAAMSAEFYGAAEEDEPEGEPSEPEPPQQTGNESLKAALGAKKPQDTPSQPAPEPQQATSPTAPAGIPTFTGDWPDSFDGPECIFNGEHLKFDEESGNYRKVEAEQPPAPPAAPRRGRPGRNASAFDFGGGKQ